MERYPDEDMQCNPQSNQNNQYNLTTDYGYTDKGLLNSVRIWGTNVASRSASANFSNNIRYIRYPESLTNALDHSESLTYDTRFGQVKTHEDANGRTTQVAYDPFGRGTSRTTPDGVVISTAYEKCDTVPCAAVMDAVYPRSVSPVIRVQTTTSPAVSPTRTQYLDKLGRVIRTDVAAFSGAASYREDVGYDAQGRVAWVSEPYTANGANGTRYTTAYGYDIRGRVTAMTQADGGSTRVVYAAASGHRVKATVTETVKKPGTGGALVSDTMQTKESYYNVLGELVMTIDAAGTTDRVTSTYTYDGSGLVDTVTVGGAVTDFDHDVAGNRSRVIDNSKFGTVTFNYTALGQLHEQTDGAGTTAYGYDLLGRRTKRDDPDGVAVWSYDPLHGKGFLASRCYDRGTATECGANPDFEETFAYNQARVSSVVTAIEAGGYRQSYTHGYTYDNRGRTETVTYPSGLTVRHCYNNRGYLEAVKEHDVACPSATAALESYREMNAYGQVTEERYGNDIIAERDFDPRSGRLTDIDTKLGTEVLQNNDYGWRTNGILHSRLSGRVGKETFVYDPLNRLQSATTVFDDPGTASRTLSMAYDALGHLTSKTSTVAEDPDVAYTTANGAHKPGRNANTRVSIGGEAYTLIHDGHGRVTRHRYDGAGTAQDKYLDWNARHLLTAVTVGDSLADTTPVARDEFAYGPGGARYYKKSTWEVPAADGSQGSTHAVEHTFYALGYKETIRVADTGNRKVETSQVTDNVLHVRTTPETGDPVTSFEYLHRDHLGSVETVTDESGNELRLMGYDPFGERRKGDWKGVLDADERRALADEAFADEDPADDGQTTVKTARGFTGHEHLDRTGLVHMNGRVYDPLLGRFLSPDPVVADATFSQAWNGYSYALNSPLSYTDPSGQIVQPSPAQASRCSPSICLNYNGGPGGGGGGYSSGTATAYSWHYSSGLVFTLSVRVGVSFGGNDDIDNRSRGSVNVSTSAVAVPVVWVRGVRRVTQVQTPEEHSPADQPMGQVADRIVIAQVQENPQAGRFDRLIEAVINGESAIPLEVIVGGVGDMEEETLEELRARGEVILSDVEVSDDQAVATGSFENAGSEETRLPQNPGVLILEPTIRGTFEVSEDQLALENLKGIRGGFVRRGPIETITISRDGDIDFTRPER